MNKKQTAVQWLTDKLCEILVDKCNELTQEQTLANHYAIKKALQMEREQIEEAYKQGDEDGYHSTESMADYEIEGRSNYLASNYYTQTFKP